MTDEEMRNAVIALVDCPRLDVFADHFLEAAKREIVSRLYPYADATWADVPEKHHSLAVDIAVYLVNKRGAEGEVRRVENGVTHEWESAGVPKSFFSGLVPFTGVPR